MKTFWRLLRLGFIYKWWMLLAAIIGSFTIGSSIGLLMTSAYIIAKAALHPSIAVLQAGIVGVRFFGISRGIFRYLERLVSHQTTFRLLANFRVRFYKGLEPLVPSGLLKHRSADLLNRVIADLKTLETFYVRVLSPPLVALLISVLMWFLMGIFNPLFSVLLLLFHLLAGLGIPVISYLYGKGLGKRIISLRSQLNILLLDGIQGLPELLVFDQTEKQKRQIHKLSKQLNLLQRHMSVISAMHESLVGVLMNAAVLSLLVAAIPMVRASQLDGVYLSVISLGIMASFEAILPLPEAMQHWEANIRAGERLFEIMDSPAPVLDPPKALSRPEKFDIQIKNLSFSYNHNAPLALRDITISVKEKGKIAIVGPSGAGKSTLINLLLRFWDYERGEIRIGGRELKKLAQEDARACLAVVSQSTYLFSGSVRENLLRARPNASAAELERAVHLAELDDLIRRLPQGADTWLGDQGLQISGGERQRLAIARAILREAPILILDEATANLDAFTEQKILATIKKIAAEKTLLHVTHRLNGLKDFNEIFVLQAGEIAEQGTQEQLLKQKGLYYRLWQRQNQLALLENFV